MKVCASPTPRNNYDIRFNHNILIIICFWQIFYDTQRSQINDSDIRNVPPPEIEKEAENNVLQLAKICEQILDLVLENVSSIPAYLKIMLHLFRTHFMPE